jgi:phospholipid/cholesterol/gamma-HCH transport system substrate-binding protein
MSAPFAQPRAVPQNNLTETLIGAAVVLAAVSILLFVYLGKGSGAGAGYPLNVRLAKADGLGTGTEVRLSGIKVGSVTDLTLDPKTYLVTVHMNIQPGVQIPADSSIMVTSAGILGGAYLSITPGGDDKMLAAGGTIENAQGTIDLMSLIGKFATTGGGTPAPAAPQSLPEGP